MVRKYKLRINEDAFEVAVEGPNNGIFHITIGETTFPAQITHADQTTGKFKVNIGETTHSIRIKPITGSTRYSVIVNELSLSVALHAVSTTPATQVQSYTTSATASTPVELAALTPGIDESDEPGTVTAPLPGRVLDVRVKPSQQILAGDVLLVLEAMKMANEIRAPHDGTVNKIHVENGTAVEKGQALVTIL
ncbi:MAG: acetyl-CoA carboxylase biotin carboxyl carrier protein [Candidatus Hodarchaeota archaeon]